ncbi:hypothetical protein G9A89_020910 [Geosiphon pyriformis]|nr:hypothetical protein G9A89_020910 [Geosiphon pyriformis]
MKQDTTQATPFELVYGRTKKRHDSQLPDKPVEFKIEDKVLLHHTKAEKQWSRKFDPKWDGPFYIEEILENGAYKLRLDNKILTKAKMEITINQQTIQYQDTRKTLQLRTPKKTEDMVDKIMAKDKPEILLNKAMDMVTSNQLGKITNAQFEKVQTQITQEAMDKTTIESLSIIQRTLSKPSDTTLAEPYQWKLEYTRASTQLKWVTHASTSNVWPLQGYQYMAPLIDFEKEKPKSTWEAYQVSWADEKHNELSLILSWNNNRKGKQTNKLTWETNNLIWTDNEQEEASSWEWNENKGKEKEKEEGMPPTATIYNSYTHHTPQQSNY